MKRIKIFLIAILCLVACVVNAQATKKVIWDYPVKPGTEEWSQFQSNEEMVKACQIPENLLSLLSTDDLADLCLRYPLLHDLFAFENTNSGLDKLFSDFNGIRELYQRKDVSNNLNNLYVGKIRSFSVLNENISDYEKGRFIVSVSTLEVLLSRIDWKESIERKSSKEVLISLVAGYERKLDYVDYFKGFGFQTNLYSRAHVIAKMDSLFVEKLQNKDNNL